MAYSPRTSYFYVTAADRPAARIAPGSGRVAPPAFGAKYGGTLTAVDSRTNKIAWQKRMPLFDRPGQRRAGHNYGRAVPRRTRRPLPGLRRAQRGTLVAMADRRRCGRPRDHLRDRRPSIPRHRCRWPRDSDRFRERRYGLGILAARQLQ